jgi:hypothetical protein
MPATSEGEARCRKAVKLAATLRQVHPTAATPATVRLLPAEGRRAAERVAGVRKGSDETWELVAQLLELEEIPQRSLKVEAKPAVKRVVKRSGR